MCIVSSIGFVGTSILGVTETSLASNELSTTALGGSSVLCTSIGASNRISKSVSDWGIVCDDVEDCGDVTGGEGVCVVDEWLGFSGSITSGGLD